ncbi:MAG: carbamoyltransferase HypF [Eubacterium sp.]|nr:carbamoyltransferase HypF [Eubacterium sp.]
MREVVITVLGLVQGIGYRPFVAELAKKMHISGTVCNAGGVVKIHAYAENEALDEFIRRLFVSFPRGGRVDSVLTEEIEGSEHFSEDFFRIIDSKNSKDDIRFLPADIATCADCEAELKDVNNRRYRYPFISCVSCGPRFSVMRALPYDRERTTMDIFTLCPECQADYVREGDIRRHAQTIACEKCGPKLIAYDLSGVMSDGESAVEKTTDVLKNGGIAAVKGIGGYHLCFDATCDEAAKRLRSFKDRESKPFAVMFKDVDEIREYAMVGACEEELLKSDARPIVLLDRTGDVSPSVCMHSNRIGAMLPCNPIQILLMDEISPLVMTSANRSGQPIITDDGKAIELLDSGCVDIVLANDRKIINGLDDSIYQVVKIDDRQESAKKERVQMIRRARGIVPEPVCMGRELRSDVFAAGGDLKSVFALGRKNMVYLSGVFGDIEDADAFDARKEAITRFVDYLDIHPYDAVGDMHPGYVSVKSLNQDVSLTSQNGEPKTKGVYHHHAHVASVMAEHNLEGKVLGLSFDGTGYGEDGNIWGSEYLVCEGDRFIRKGHFSEVKTIGGDSPKDADKSLAAFMYAASKRGSLSEQQINSLVDKLDSVSDRMLQKEIREKKNFKNNLKIWHAALDNDINCMITTSMGRLFDAVAAGLDICHQNSYEGECPEKLQILAEEYCKNGDKLKQDLGIGLDNYICFDEKKREYVIDSVRLVADIFQKYLDGENVDRLAYIFHIAVAELSVKLADTIAKENDIHQIALSGGTMLNRLLASEMVARFEELGYDVYMNEKVPCSDAGLALGQVYLMTY